MKKTLLSVVAGLVVINTAFYYTKYGASICSRVY